ncbi:hypothetical protein KUTeg_011212 [Tegillarca granosa]|uniref:Uncharacterized protein n=1 Tax=Tegillarca granosa TaxID=220873 RepID=A0ABQ9F6L0_TEGGR|nr:hypothetical protein KUTeg_011212 [Tegillarca granosa]
MFEALDKISEHFFHKPSEKCMKGLKSMNPSGKCMELCGKCMELSGKCGHFLLQIPYSYISNSAITVK